MRNGESSFEFFNRSARPEIQTARELLDEIASGYPADDVPEILARIRSGNDVHFKSATFELFLYAMLVRLGCTLKPHPELSNGSNSRPDFMVTTPDAEEFYLEAVLTSDSNEVDNSAEVRKGVVYDALSARPHQNFMIDIDGEGDPTSSPRGRKLAEEIHRWLDQLDPDQVISTIDNEGFDAVETYEWVHEGWNLEFRPIPLRQERRGKSKNLIGIFPASGGYTDSWSPMRDAVKFKGSKYGKLDRPFIVAVNHSSFHLERIDEMQALYGQEEFTFSNGNEPKMTRAPNGIWMGKSGAQYTRVSGVWIFNDLHLTSFASRKGTIYFNPWGVLPLPNFLKRYPHAIPANNKMEYHSGISLIELFGLHEKWPEEPSG